MVVQSRLAAVLASLKLSLPRLPGLPHPARYQSQKEKRVQADTSASGYSMNA